MYWQAKSSHVRWCFLCTSILASRRYKEKYYHRLLTSEISFEFTTHSGSATVTVSWLTDKNTFFSPHWLIQKWDNSFIHPSVQKATNGVLPYLSARLYPSKNSQSVSSKFLLQTLKPGLQGKMYSLQQIGKKKWFNFLKIAIFVGSLSPIVHAC